MARILRIYLENGLRQDAEAGRHNFFRILRAAFEARGFQVAFHRSTPAERIRSAIRPGYTLLHAEEPEHDRALTVWRAYLYPFWRIERTARRAAWRLAGQAFDAAAVDGKAAERFLAFWQGRLMSEPPRPPGSGYVFVPLQGRLLEHRSFQTMSSASAKMALDIFDCPTLRSTKTMGTSAISIPAWSTRYFISIWKT